MKNYSAHAHYLKHLCHAHRGTTVPDKLRLLRTRRGTRVPGNLHSKRMRLISLYPARDLRTDPRNPVAPTCFAVVRCLVGFSRVGLCCPASRLVSLLHQ